MVCMRRNDITIGVTHTGVMVIAQGSGQRYLYDMSRRGELDHMVSGLYYSQLSHRVVDYADGRYMITTPSQLSAKDRIRGRRTFKVDNLHGGDVRFLDIGSDPLVANHCVI